jgi:hypothetical protein
MNPAVVDVEVRRRWQELSNALSSDEWKRLFPGKALFAQFASLAGIKSGFLKNAYMASARRTAADPFAEIAAIFQAWT